MDAISSLCHGEAKAAGHDDRVENRVVPSKKRPNRGWRDRHNAALSTRPAAAPPGNERSARMSRNLVHPRDAIMRTMERIYRYRMTTTSGGNLSIRTDSGDTYISRFGCVVNGCSAAA